MKLLKSALLFLLTLGSDAKFTLSLRDRKVAKTDPDDDGKDTLKNVKTSVTEEAETNPSEPPVPALSPQEVTYVLNRIVDIDHNGLIYIDEMRDTVLHMRVFEAERHAEGQFHFADLDNDGSLSLSELLALYHLGGKSLAEKLSEEEQKSADMLTKMHEHLKSGNEGAFGILELTKTFVPLLFPDSHEAIAKIEFELRDSDGDQLLSLEEFIASEKRQDDSEDQLEAMRQDFQQMDTDKSGSVSLEEFRFFIAFDHDLEEILLDLLRVADSNKDYALDQEEIKAGMEGLSVHPLIHQWFGTSLDIPESWIKDEQRQPGQGDEL